MCGSQGTHGKEAGTDNRRQKAGGLMVRGKAEETRNGQGPGREDRVGKR